MEWSPETLQFLSHCFLNTLSPSPEPRRGAERSLADASERSNYGLAVLRLVAEPAVDEQVKQAAAVNFKNHMKSRWAPATRASNRNAVTVNPIPDTEKKQIKDLIVPLMLSATPKVQSQLSEALAVIGQHDFPKLWPELLPELVAMLQKAVEGTDYTSVKGILGTINSLFKKFRYQYWTNEVKLDLRYCLDNFAAPLLEVFKVTATLIESRSGSGGPADALKPLFESQRLCCRISYSFNFQELPDYFEDHMEEWMVLFQRYLTATYPTLEQGGEDSLALVDNLRAAICDILALYMGRDEDPFKRYVDEFGRAVRDLLVAASASSGRDKLVIPATKFLTMVSTNAHQNKLFSEDSSLDQICRSIVIPNVMLRDEDEELFEMNYIEFIRRDMEGSDLDTRRRIACELLKAIAINYKEKVSQLVLALVQSMLAMFAENPLSNWKYKDCAIYVVLSLSTTRAGGASVSDTVIDVATFFTSVIVPELQGQDVNSYPFLKAGALKFFTLFRNVLPKSNAIVLVPDVVRFLASESNVVHSYAAICIEKLLLVKDEGARARYLASDIAPFLPVLMTNLFNALGFPESEENQYIMKCIMRVLGVADISPEVAASCISRLTYILNSVCKNPKNPIFNHYLFESVAVLIRRACTNPTLLSQFEAGLFPSLESILSNNVIEFFPYTFQLLAQLVELNRPPLPNHYMQFFNILLFPELWKKPSDVPALVPLLQAFLRMAPSELKAQEKLDKVLGIFSHLVSVPSTEEQGFFVLNTIVGNVGYDVLAPHMGSIWIALFTRLQNSRTMKFLKSLIIFMSLVVVKHGWQSLVEPMNSVQPNVFLVILEQFWIPNLKQITGFVEVKLAAVASTKLICECPALLDPSTARLWGKMLDSIVTLLSRPEEERVEDETEVPDFAESGGYSATFVRLNNSGKKEDDPLKEIKDPKAFLLSSLSNLPAFSTGGYRQVINENLEPANQAALFQLCGTPANA